MHRKHRTRSSWKPDTSTACVAGFSSWTPERRLCCRHGKREQSVTRRHWHSRHSPGCVLAPCACSTPPAATRHPTHLAAFLAPQMALLGVADHHTRLQAGQAPGHTRAVGVLFGTQSEDSVDIILTADSLVSLEEGKAGFNLPLTKKHVEIGEARRPRGSRQDRRSAPRQTAARHPRRPRRRSR